MVFLEAELTLSTANTTRWPKKCFKWCWGLPVCAFCLKSGRAACASPNSSPKKNYSLKKQKRAEIRKVPEITWKDFAIKTPPSLLQQHISRILDPFAIASTFIPIYNLYFGCICTYIKLFHINTTCMDVIPLLGGGIQLLGWNSPTLTLLPQLTPVGCGTPLAPGSCCWKLIIISPGVF